MDEVQKFLNSFWLSTDVLVSYEMKNTYNLILSPCQQSKFNDPTHPILDSHPHNTPRRPFLSLWNSEQQVHLCH